MEGFKLRREQTIILGNRKVTLDNVGNKPVTYSSRSELKKDLKSKGLYSKYFS